MGKADPTERPVRAPDVRSGGEMPGTGFDRPQWLVQRGDRYLQVSELLYRIAGLADGTRTADEIAVLVSAAMRRNVSGQDVRELVETKLMPSGIIAGGPQAGPAPSGPSPLAIALGAKLIGPGVIDPLARLLSVFFVPGVAIAVLAATIATRFWLYAQHGVTPGIGRLLQEPSLMLLIGALAIGGAAFHELGHAAALRVAGGRARGMGIGLYFIFPVFYTDVTDSYRLGRWRRVLTDLGGFHFNLVFSLFVLAAYVITHNEALLVAVTLVDLEILHQMLPLGRLDGYWLLADLTGVPDFFSLAGPYLRSLLPGGDRSLPKLRPIARFVFGAYLLLIGPLLALLAVFLVSRLPAIAFATLDSFLQHAARFDEARAAQDFGAGARAVGEAVLLTLPVLAIAFFLGNIARSVAQLFLKIAGSTRRERLAAGASVVAAAALVLALWAPLSTTVRATAADLGGALIDSGVVDPTTAPTPRLRLPAQRSAPPPNATDAPPARATAGPSDVAPASPTGAPASTTGAQPSPTAAPASPTAAPASPTAAPSTTAPSTSPSVPPSTSSPPSPNASPGGALTATPIPTASPELR
jgi:putative peptide zinc metalloprotease protein